MDYSQISLVLSGDDRNTTLGIFTMIQSFQNDVCIGDGSLRGMGGVLSGNCYTKQECDELKGTAAGDCADGYGVCCVCKNHKFPIYFNS